MAGGRGGAVRSRAGAAGAGAGGVSTRARGAWRVRRAGAEDGAAVAEMVGAAFSELSVGEQVERIQAEGPELLGAYAETMQRRMRDKTYKQCFNTLQNATRARVFAGMGARYRREQQARAQLELAAAQASLAAARASAEGEVAGSDDGGDLGARLAEAETALASAKEAHAQVLAAQPSKKEEREEREVRMWHCLIAEMRETREVVGTATLCWYQAEAMLPAPLPTLQPHLMYISNTAVSKEHRRKGIASRVLLECERLALRWGEKCVYLHVEEDNTTARTFYEANGYYLYKKDPFRGVFQKRKLLLRKELIREGQSTTAEEGSE